jgi:uroporphyrinogen-III synthase
LLALQVAFAPLDSNGHIKIMTKPTLLMIRPRLQSEQFLADLTATTGKSFDAIVSPVMGLETLPLEQNLHNAQFLLFTSSNGVNAFAEQSADRGTPALCVGQNTAQKAQNHGFRTQCADGTADDLLALTLSLAKPSGGPIYYISGTRTAQDLSVSLTAVGYTASRVIVYRQFQTPLSFAAKTCLQTKPTIIPVFSQKSADYLGLEINNLSLFNTLFVCISPTVASVFSSSTCKVVSAAEPTRSAMLAAVSSTI